MRSRHVDTYHPGPLACPIDGCQDAIGCIVWRVDAKWTYRACFGVPQAPCSQSHIPISYGHSAPQKPQGHCLMLSYPEGMIHRTLAPPDLLIPLDQRRIGRTHCTMDQLILWENILE